MKNFKILTLVVVIVFAASLLFACNANGSQQAGASAQQSIPQPAEPSQSASQAASAQSQASAQPSTTASKAVLPDDDPSVTGDESALITDGDGIIKQVPITTDFNDGNYMGIILNAFHVAQGTAVDFDEIEISGGEKTNENKSIVFLLLNDTISYTLPDDTKKDNASSDDISGLAEYLTSDYYYTITVKDSKITAIQYGGSL